MSFTIESAQTIFPDTQVADAMPITVAYFNQLSAEDQLALLWSFSHVFYHRICPDNFS
jgi:hypothetical protein